MSLYQVVMMAIIIIAIIIFLIIFFRPDPSVEVVTEEEDKLTTDYLVRAMLDYVGEYQNLNVESLDANRSTIEKIKRDQESINKATKNCSFGDRDSKLFLRELTKQALIKNFGINEETIDRPIRFDNFELLSYRDKFDILMYIYEKKFNKDGLEKLITVNNLCEPKGEGFKEHYAITVSELEHCFSQNEALVKTLTYSAKVDILAERIYASIWGNGVIDTILDMDVDGVRCGTGGFPANMLKYLGETYDEEHGRNPVVSYNTVWMMRKGQNVQLSFLGFGSEKEFERVAKKIYKYDSPGAISETKPAKINYRMDGSRVLVLRPPATTNWAFFVRKLDAGGKMNVNDLFNRHKGWERLVEALYWIVGCSMNLGITGEQGSGKTTTMMSVVDFIREGYTIRTQETAFELNLQWKYPWRDVIGIKETSTFSGQDGINVAKKTDGSCNLTGEVADAMTAALSIQTGQTGSNQLMFTGHMKTPTLLVQYFRDCLCNMMGMNEKSAETMVASVVNFNLHQVKEVNGDRYAQRLSMIVPHVNESYSEDLEQATKQYYYRMTDRPHFDSKNLIVYENEEYVFCDDFYPEFVDEMSSRLNPEQLYRFKDFLTRVHQEAEEYKATHCNGSTDPIVRAAEEAVVPETLNDVSFMNKEDTYDDWYERRSDNEPDLRP